MTSPNYFLAANAKRTRTAFLCAVCLFVGMVGGGSVVWATRPADEATTVTALADGSPETTAPTPTGALSTITLATTQPPITTTPITTTSLAEGRSTDVAKRCGATEEARSPIATVAEFRALVTRVWMQCTDVSAFGTNDEVGFELLGDSTVYKLYASEDGTVTRGEGPDHRGTWNVIDVSAMNGRPMYQIQMLVGRGGGGGIAVLTAEPMKMRFSRMTAFADYVTID